MTTSDLPADLAELATDRLVAAGAAREQVLRDLIATHPAHAAALREMCSDLANVEHLLEAAYPDRAVDEPSSLGGCRVLRRLGEGAFGVVYLCAQERPIARQVAIKVLRPGAGGAQTMQRFAAERQVLAQLNHAGITQVFDAGELPDGRPYFVMEYVDGAPIDAWCRTNQTPCTERLRLFAHVCRAVGHAHARGIVHRDLKPANVLVVATPDGPMPKVIDFGIAKALAAPNDEPRTEFGRVVGTPGYMSPEQAEGRIDDVDARADVWALGVMLYQLLTDTMPWSSRGTDTEPMRPSARVTTNDEEPATPAAAKRRRAAELRGDLDWITLKALARARDERYASVALLAADIERHLRGETVSVGPPSLRYRLRKFCRRHRAATLLGAAGLAATAAALWALTRASDLANEATSARSELAAGVATSRAFVTRLLQRAEDPTLFATAHGDEVRKALGDEALTFTEQLLSTRAEDATLRRDRCDACLVVAEVHRVLGELTRSRAVAAQAVALASELVEAAPDALERRGLLGRAMRQEARAVAAAGDHGAAYAGYVTAVAHLEACAAADRSWLPHVAVATGEMAAVTPPSARLAAIAAFAKAVQCFDAVRLDAVQRAATRPDYVRTLLGFGRCRLQAGQIDEAAACIAGVPDELGELGPTRLGATTEFHLLRGEIAWAGGKREAALPDLEAAVSAADEWCRQQPRRVAAHRFRLAALSTLAGKVGYVGDFTASAAAFRRTIDAAETMAAQFPGDPTTKYRASREHYQFAYSLWERFMQQPLAEAAQHLDKAIAIDAELGAATFAGRFAPWKLLTLRAQIEDSRGDAAAAAATWREVERTLPLPAVDDEHDRGLQIGAFAGLARMLLHAGEPAAATPWLARARAVIAAHPTHARRLVDVGWLEAQVAGRAGDAAAAVAAADRILEARPTWLGWYRAADCLRIAGGCPADTGSAAALGERARELQAKVVAALDANVAAKPDDPFYVIPWGAASVRLAEHDEAAGDLAPARERVAAALARLDAARSEAHHDQWDEGAYRAGIALLDRLRR